mmetsp:Transcript_22215/g.57210  ORF Transcript_22215/g.57210 Transcript_22215/m.57210 type:complete len:267 (-) Transcript_22215:229-1029(-)
MPWLFSWLFALLSALLSPSSTRDISKLRVASTMVARAGERKLARDDERKALAGTDANADEGALSFIAYRFSLVPIVSLKGRDPRLPSPSLAALRILSLTPLFSPSSSTAGAMKVSYWRSSVKKDIESRHWCKWLLLKGFCSTSSAPSISSFVLSSSLQPVVATTIVHCKSILDSTCSDSSMSSALRPPIITNTIAPFPAELVAMLALCLLPPSCARYWPILTALPLPPIEPLHSRTTSFKFAYSSTLHRAVSLNDISIDSSTRRLW